MASKTFKQVEVVRHITLAESVCYFFGIYLLWLYEATFLRQQAG